MCWTRLLEEAYRAPGCQAAGVSPLFTGASVHRGVGKFLPSQGLERGVVLSYSSSATAELHLEMDALMAQGLEVRNSTALMPRVTDVRAN